jgi:hypothetical protein
MPCRLFSFVRSNPLCMTRSIFFYRSLPLCWARRLLFFFRSLPLSSVCARNFFYPVSSSFFLFHPAVHEMSGRAQNLFLDASAQRCQPARQKFLFGAVRSAAAAHAETFFFSVRSLQLCRGASDSFIFFLCPVASTLQGSQRFFYFFFLCPVASTLQGSQRFFFFAQVASGQQLLRAQIFLTGHSHTLLSSHADFCFLSTAMLKCRARRTFLLRSFFLLPSGLICSDTLF